MLDPNQADALQAALDQAKAWARFAGSSVTFDDCAVLPGTGETARESVH